MEKRLIDKVVMGIDFGMENCQVSVLIGGKKVNELMHLDNMFRAYFPTLAYFKDESKVEFGSTAQIYATMNDIRYPIAKFVKRQLGIEESFMVDIWDDTKEEWTREPFAPFGKKMSPEHIAGLILARLHLKALSNWKNIDMSSTGKVDEYVFTYPANWSNKQIKAFEKAIELAGVPLEKISRKIPEPVAIAMAVMEKEDLVVKSINKPLYMFVFDSRVGTTDVALVEINPNEVKVLASANNNQFGSYNIDLALTENFISRYQTNTGEMWPDTDKDNNNLWDTARKTKEILNISAETDICLKIQNKDNFCFNLTRSDWEDLFAYELKTVVATLVNEVMSSEIVKKTEIAKTDIDYVVMSGSTSFIPLVQQYVQKAFDGKELYIDDKIMRRGVADGAALCGKFMPKSGNKLADEAVFKNTIMPVHSISEINYQEGHNSLHYPIITVLFHQGTEYSTDENGIMWSEPSVSVTMNDDQENVWFKLVQGKDSKVSQNIPLKQATFKNLTLRPAGETRVALVVGYDQNTGKAVMKAEEIGTNNKATLEVTELPKNVFLEALTPKKARKNVANH